MSRKSPQKWKKRIGVGANRVRDCPRGPTACMIRFHQRPRRWSRPPPACFPPVARPRMTCRPATITLRALSVFALAVVSPDLRAGPVSFRNEVMAVLSRAGCNTGPCHGNLNGKGGFKLSLRGQGPDFDFTALTREMLARRVDPHRPEQSLLL